MEENLIQLYAEYSGLTEDEVRLGVENFGTFNSQDWQLTPGSTWAEKAERFYGTAQGYIFDLIAGNRSKYELLAKWQREGHWEWLSSAGPEFLEFGGGLGLGCALMRDRGHKVTYVDVDGTSSRFARWYFKRQGYTDIEVVLTPAVELVLPAGRQWDFVFTEAVIEHLIDPVGTVEKLARAVRPGGVLYLLVDAHACLEAFPMHRDIYIAELLAGSQTLASMEHAVHQGDGLNVFRQREPVSCG